MNPEGGAIERHPKRIPRSKISEKGLPDDICPECHPFVAFPDGMRPTHKYCRFHIGELWKKTIKNYGEEGLVDVPDRIKLD